MKENMMLQVMDEILKVDLQTLKAEMSQLTTNLAAAVEKVTSNIMSQVEQALKRNSDQAEEARRLHESEQGKVLEHVLLLSHNVSGRLGRLESAWLRRSEAEAQETAFQQDKFSPTRGDSLILNSLWKELQQTRAELKASQKWAAQHLLPAGKSMCATFIGELALFGGPDPDRHPINTPLKHLPLHVTPKQSYGQRSSFEQSVQTGRKPIRCSQKIGAELFKPGIKEGFNPSPYTGQSQLGSHLLQGLQIKTVAREQ